MKFKLLGLLCLLGVGSSLVAQDLPFPAEREWLSKLGDVVTGSYQGCTGTKVVLKAKDRRMEIPLNRLDEEDAAFVKTLIEPSARRDLKLAELFWPLIMKELSKVNWQPVLRDINPSFNAAARKNPQKNVKGTVKIEGLVCDTSSWIVKGKPFFIRQGYSAQTRSGSGGMNKFDVSLKSGESVAYYDDKTGLLTGRQLYQEERTGMRGAVASLLPANMPIAAKESREYRNEGSSDGLPNSWIKGPYETCKPNGLERKQLSIYWDTKGKVACGVMYLQYDNADIYLLFDRERKLMNAPGLGYAVLLSRASKKGKTREGGEYYYHVAFAADGLPVYHHEGPEDSADLNPLMHNRLRDSEKKEFHAKEQAREKELRSKLESRQGLMESAIKRKSQRAAS